MNQQCIQPLSLAFFRATFQPLHPLAETEAASFKGSLEGHPQYWMGKGNSLTRGKVIALATWVAFPLVSNLNVLLRKRHFAFSLETLDVVVKATN